MPDELPGSDANRLYWETDASVAEIADQLTISRRALYDAIEPRPAGVICTQCEAGLVFRNRTAAERRRAECLECRIEVALDTVMGGAAAAGQADTDRPVQRRAPVSVPGEPPSGHGAVLGGSLLAGLALGAAAGYLLRQR
jgi:hypothetical protein